MSKGGWKEFDHSRVQAVKNSLKIEDSKGSRQVRVQRTRAGKKGKLVTVIFGLGLSSLELKKLLKKLKSSCGTGGTVKGDALELQGDQVVQSLKLLREEGFEPKQSGG